jgi:nitrogen fixation protein FixH
MNWGHFIVIVFALFVAGILTMVVKASKENNQLVTTNYYEKELVYQKKIDARKNASALKDTVALNQQGSKLFIQLPSDMEGNEVDAFFHLYCPFDEANDIQQRLKLNSGLVELDLNNIVPGAYVLKSDWHAAGVNYYTENKIKIE